MLVTGIVITAMLLLAFFIGLHVSVTLGLTAFLVGLGSFGTTIMDIFGHIPWNVVNSQSFPVVPMFFLMGELLLRSGITDELYESLNKWLYKLPGGMLYTNIISCGVFSCVSGSSVATAATIGSVALPAMLRRNYPERITLGSLAAGGTLGILIPPSIIFIMYGLLAEVSIADLYIAATIPGVIMLSAFCVVILLFSLIFPELMPKRDNIVIPWKEKIACLVSLAPVLILFLLVLGTFYLGIATVMESAAFGATGAFGIALFKRRVNVKMLKEAFLSTAGNTGMVVFILMGAFLLQFIFTFFGIPSELAKRVIKLGLSPLELIIIIGAMYFILGMFMDTPAILVTTVPILAKMMADMDVNLIWFGVITVIMMEMCLITPPVGMNIFVIQGVRERMGGVASEKRIVDVFIGAVPFVIAMLVVLSIIIAFPQLSLYLLGG